MSHSQQQTPSWTCKPCWRLFLRMALVRHPLLPNNSSGSLNGSLGASGTTAPTKTSVLAPPDSYATGVSGPGAAQVGRAQRNAAHWRCEYEVTGASRQEGKQDRAEHVQPGECVLKGKQGVPPHFTCVMITEHHFRLNTTRSKTRSSRSRGYSLRRMP